jgi:glycosyltransferase involved in cell wall biosynthesis
MSNPFFTVIIPTYNRPLALYDAIQSVLKQSFSDFEILVVNNGEEALALGVIHQISDKRLRYINEARKGANNARNTGIENGAGRFICFLDDDDLYLPHHLKTLYDLILVNRERTALYRTFTSIERSSGVMEEQIVGLKDPSETALEHSYKIMLFMGCVCCSRSILGDLKFDPSIEIAQDYQLFSRILARFPMIESTEITTLYRKTEDSTSSPTFDKYLKYIKVYSDLFKDPLVSAQLSAQAQNNLLFRFHDFMLSGHYNEMNWEAFIKYSFRAAGYKRGYFFRKGYLKLFLKKVMRR